MAKKRTPMNKIKEVLRLKYDCGLSNRSIASCLKLGPSTISELLTRFKQSELGWPLPESCSDADLTQALYHGKKASRDKVMPDFTQYAVELRRKGMTKMLLWQEYHEQYQEQAYAYTQFCEHFTRWFKTQKRSMRQLHVAGDKLFIDYCGPRLQVVNPDTGEVREAEVFVATLGASNYTYAEATYTQQLEDWVMSHARCFEFLGGVPDMVIPDNLKSAVTKTCRYEPDLNPTYHQLAEYFNVAVIPARPYKPKDKSKAEVGVQIVERWIMARLRHQTFYSLAQLNGEITKLLQVMNNKVMKQYQQSRQHLFDTLDKPALHPLPVQPYQYTQIKTVRVHIDYHVEIEKHYYSVPFQWVKKRLRAHVSTQLVQLYHEDTLIAQHPRSHRLGGHTTQAHHMPKEHQKQHEQSPINLRSWALSIGEYTHQVIELQLGRRRHPEQAYRVCLGILSLAKTYSKPRLEQACYRAIAMNTTALKSIKQMLKKGLDKQPLPTQQTEPEKSIEHDNIRGTNYYH